MMDVSRHAACRVAVADAICQNRARDIQASELQIPVRPFIASPQFHTAERSHRCPGAFEFLGFDFLDSHRRLNISGPGRSRFHAVQVSHFLCGRCFTRQHVDNCESVWLCRTAQNPCFRFTAFYSLFFPSRSKLLCGFALSADCRCDRGVFFRS